MQMKYHIFDLQQRYEFMVNHRSYTLKPEKISGLNEIQTHDLCDTSAVLYQLRKIQPAGELVTL